VVIPYKIYYKDKIQMWYFTYRILNLIIKLLCVLAGRSTVDIWWWPLRGRGVLCIYNFINLTFRAPCIVIHSYNKSQRDVLILKFILIKNSTCSGQTYCLSSGVLILYSQQLVFVIRCASEVRLVHPDLVSRQST
jgi:hypothetical protein